MSNTGFIFVWNLDGGPYVVLYMGDYIEKLDNTLTFRRVTECILHSIVKMYCAVCIPTSCIASSQITLMTKIGIYLVGYLI